MSPAEEPLSPSIEDIRSLKRDKYDDVRGVEDTDEFRADFARLAAGEPLAYVIGWIPFLGLRIKLDSHPLIPRPETEWWTEQLIARLREKFADQPFTLLDLCAGSGCIGLAVLSAFPHARASFGELVPDHAALIEKNLAVNGLDATRADIRTSDLFSAFKASPPDSSFDIIATNPPYIPETRTLEASVTGFEPSEALFADADGLDLIRKIITEASAHLARSGELWIECDISNIEEAKECAEAAGFGATIRTDQYGRSRLVVAYLSS